MLLSKKKPVVQSSVDLIPDSLRPLCVPIGSVKLWDKNPRRNDEAAKKLAALIRIHKFRKPIVVDKQGVIVAGNTAYKAARLLGMTEVPVVRHDDLKSGTAATTAFAISDNKAAEFAVWDDDVLAELMQAKDFPPENRIETTGFSEQEMRGILMEADLKKIDKAEETSDGIRAKVVLLVAPEHRAELVQAVKKWITAENFDVEVA